MPEESETPMLRQYHQIKAKHRDCVLFFRLGDFYEMFYDDAKTASGLLDLVLTSRGKGTSSHVPMCGIPYHSAENYISKLIKAGLKVAICEQVEDPAAAKGIVRRDVVRVITSGTFLDDQSSDARYILCLSPNKTQTGIAFMDPSTGTIQTRQYPDIRHCLEVLSRLSVHECIYPARAENEIKKLFTLPVLKTKGVTLSPQEDWCFNKDIAEKNLLEHFRVQNLRGFGIQDMPEAVSSTGALLEYLKQMNKQPLRHIDRITLFTDQEYASVSPAAVYGLELDTLFQTINHALSALGKRTLHFWLYHPLKNPSAICERQNAVSLLKDAPSVQKHLKEILGRMPDLEKNISRLSCGYTNAKDIFAVRNALALIPALQEALGQITPANPLLTIEDIPDLRCLLETAVNPDMPMTKYEGKIFQKGFHSELDELRDIQEHGREWLRQFQQNEAKRTGIPSLKVGFNRVFGYYIEITKTHQASVPPDYIRKQTLVNGERFITPELKDYEDKILNAQEKILAIENTLIQKLQKDILERSALIHARARQIGQIDALYSLALLAQRPGYTAPDVNTETLIDIRDGRHPVVEQAAGTAFVPNDTLLDCGDNHLVILTGPNMAGKSTYIRQIAILVILAQMGSYIPASTAVIGTVDKIFTRIGAHDDIAKGQSTFMVEMNEMADILNNLSERSLVILDEVGRGTSTSDGLSLAWALAEHLQKTRTRTLFATHFHELTVLADEYPDVNNYNVAVKEWGEDIVFLHKIIPGSSDDSYGLYVAKLAGVPESVIARARHILTQLELKDDFKGGAGPCDQKITEEQQLDFFGRSQDPVEKEMLKTIASLNPDHMTPMEALAALHALSAQLKQTQNHS